MQGAFWRGASGVGMEGGSREGDVLARLREQLQERLAEHPDWPDFIRDGRPSDALALQADFRVWWQLKDAIRAHNAETSQATLLNIDQLASQGRQQGASGHAPVRPAPVRAAPVRASGDTTSAAVPWSLDGSSFTGRRPEQPESSTAQSDVSGDANADDLTRIRGITRALAAQLREMGITHYAQIAAWRLEDIAKISAALSLGRRISRENWIEQAARLLQSASRQPPEDDAATRPAQGASRGRPSGEDQPVSSAMDASAYLYARAEVTIKTKQGDGSTGNLERQAHQGAQDQSAPEPEPEVKEDGALAGSASSGQDAQTVPRSDERGSPQAPASATSVSTEAPVPSISSLGPVDSAERASEAPAQIAPHSNPAVEPATATAQPEPLPEPPLAQQPALAKRPPDLLDIRGVTPELKRRLRAQGVSSVSQIAKWRASDVNRIEALLGPAARISRDNWIEQAAMLTAGCETRYQSLRGLGAVGALVPAPRANVPWLPRLRIGGLGATPVPSGPGDGCAPDAAANFAENLSLKRRIDQLQTDDPDTEGAAFEDPALDDAATLDRAVVAELEPEPSWFEDEAEFTILRRLQEDRDLASERAQKLLDEAKAYEAADRPDGHSGENDAPESCPTQEPRTEAASERGASSRGPHARYMLQLEEAEVRIVTPADRKRRAEEAQN